MIYHHYKYVPWDDDRWPNFSPDEDFIRCKCCNEFYFSPLAMDMLQAARSAVGKPFYINSGHRCQLYNARVSGAKKSQHLQIAFDISTNRHDRKELFVALKNAGFTGFGFYRSFIHVDIGSARNWYGEGGFRIWKGISH